MINKTVKTTIYISLFVQIITTAYSLKGLFLTRPSIGQYFTNRKELQPQIYTRRKPQFQAHHYAAKYDINSTVVKFIIVFHA